MKNASKLALLTAVLAAALALSACGSGDDGDTISGSFELTEEAPEEFDDLSGEADLTRADGETTVKVNLSGLEPEAEFVSHLHFGGCAAPEVGGAHFKFDLEGSDEPPNEIHMTFESDADGNGEAEATADQEVPDGDAGSVVVHLASATATTAGEGEGHDHGGGHGHPDKIACAELEGTSPKAAEAVEDGDAMEAGDSMEHEHGDSMEHGDGAMDGDSMKKEEAGGAGAGATIVIAEGEPVGGVEELEYKAGEQIEFTVESDVAEEIHVHGYDLSKDVAAGGSVSFSFPAEIEGIFEVEMEVEGIQIAELRVNP